MKVRLGSIAAFVYLTFAPYIIAKNFMTPFSIPILHVVSPPSKRCHIDGSRALRLPWNTTSTAYARTFIHMHAGSTRSGQRGRCCGLRKSSGVNNDELNFDDEDDIRNRHGSLEAASKRHQQHLSPPSLDDRAPRDWLAGLVAKGKGTPKTTTSPSSSFSDPLNKAKAASKTEKGMHPVHRRWQRPIHVNVGGCAKGGATSAGSFNLGLTAVLSLVRRRGRVLSICSISVCSGTCGGG